MRAQVSQIQQVEQLLSPGCAGHYLHTSWLRWPGVWLDLGSVRSLVMLMCSMCVCVCVYDSVTSNSLQPPGL